VNRRMFLRGAGALASASVVRGLPREGATSSARSESAILRIIESYPSALVGGDVKRWESLFWLDDPNFTVIENDRAAVMGAEYIRQLSDLVSKRAGQPIGQRWYDTKVRFIADNCAYTTSLREELNDKKISRVTLLFIRKRTQWRIVHCHFSYVP
jgi:hypothetical protein